MYLLGALFWMFLSGWMAYGIGRLLTFKLESRWWRWGVGAVLLPLIFIAPLADEIVGKYQFDQLCEVAEKEARIYGTIPVGEELYTPEGKRRGRNTGDDPFALNELISTLWRWESKTTYLQLAIPIQRYDESVFERKTGRLLAQWRAYGTSGGWLSHKFEAPFFVRPTCRPKFFESIENEVLPFSKESNR